VVACQPTIPLFFPFEKLLSDGKYNYSAFPAHQAAEKVLNALIIEVLRDSA
jgi:HEPN domain-containing protein